MYRKLIVMGCISLFLFSVQTVIAGTASPKGASTYIVWPHEGATVHSPFTVVFGLRGMGVAPAGTKKDNTGHFHLIIDAPTPAASKAIGKSDNLRHFGGGQTETVLDLPKGTHTLQLMMGDHAHVPHDPPVKSRMITIHVK